LNRLQEEEEDLSEEDQQLKDNLELMVERARDPEAGVAKMAIQSIAEEIRTATASMTSVPKPLKFLRPHYDTLKTHFESLTASAPHRAELADVISVLAMTSAAEDSRETLRYKLASGATEAAHWGHEYLRHLAGEISAEFEERRTADPPAPVEDLMSLVSQIVPWQMTHNAEPEAVDLCLEVDRLDLAVAAVDSANCSRTCLYLLACAAYLPEPEDAAVLRAAFDSYAKVGRATDGLRVALRARDHALAAEAFATAADDGERKQMAYMLGEEHMWLDLEAGPAALSDDDLKEQLAGIMGNTRLSERFLALARDLDIMEAKTPEDVYKMHLVEGRATSGPAVDSARANLAATFVNAFVNAGFGQDKLVTAAADGDKPEGEGDGAGGSASVHWIFRNKDHGKVSAAASLGMVLLWDVEGGLPQIDRFLYATDSNVVAGASLAVGIVASGIVDEVDAAFAILSDYVGREEPAIRNGATLGLGIAYAGRNKEEVAELLLPVAMDPEVPADASGTAALAVALSFAGATNGDAVEAILQGMMLRPEADLTSPGGRLMALALGILFLGRQEAVEPTLEVARTLPEKASRYLATTLEACAYAGTGDVLKVQQLLALCGEHIEAEENEEWKAAHQAVAALGLGLVACGEELGSQMAHRALEHLLTYGEATVRRGVPLALALLNVSNPDVSVMDTLSRLSHDADVEVAMGAVLALGLLGAGTNNARLAGLLRQLSSYYFKDPTLLFLVRVAQGIAHAGKGLVTLDPHHAGTGALSRPALAGILTVLFCCLDAKATIAGKMHHLLYCLVPAMRPRMLMTVDEDGVMLPVSVRVGQAVDVVAQAGRPKTITGFQTHTTPVLLAAGERAELGTEKYVALSPTLEGTVVLRKNPEYVDMQE
jgi:26S proteasome regulatory subunit N1